MRAARKVALVLVLLLCLSHTRSQLVLDDVAEDDELVESVPQQQPTDPLTKLLQWGVDNTEHGSLAERAKAVREGRAQPMKLDKEVMDAMFGTKVKYLQTCVKNLHEALASADEDKLVDALEELESEVSDIDNANDLDHATVDGLEPVLKLLSHPSTRVRASALWVVGTTVQSNPKAQEHLISKKEDGYDVVHLILLPLREATQRQKLQAADPKLLSKALYALGTLVRGASVAQEAFVAAQGPQSLNDFLAALSGASREDAEARAAWLPVQRKAVALVGDLMVEDRNIDAAQPAARRAVEAMQTALAAMSPQAAAASVLDLMGSADRELEEKALVSLIALLNGRVTAPSAAQILEGAGAEAKISAVLNLARRHLARGEDGAAWEEVAVLAEQLSRAVRNVTQVPGGVV